MVDQLRLIPQNGAVLQALAQQVLCWARKPNGQRDGRVHTGTGWNTHIVVPGAVCDAYGAPPFTAMDGQQTITCPAPGDGQVTYYIFESDVPSLNISDCTPLDQLPTPTGVTATPGDTQVTLNWAAVTSAENYVVQYRETGAADWTAGPTVAAPTLTADVTGLTNGTGYDFQVKATATGVADSAWSATVTATPQVGG